MAPRRRLDAELVRRGFASDLAAASELIGASRVTVGGAIGSSPSSQIDPAAPLHVLDPPKTFVGRGAYKLEAALEEFSIDCLGKFILDAGSSTGGFTDCVLQRGAERVLAVDVGRGQLHQRLLVDPRVDVREQTDIRDVTPESISCPVDLVVADLSFISLKSVLAGLVALAKPEADFVLLVKPQFEATRAEASIDKGVIRNPEVWKRVLNENGDTMKGVGLGMMGCMRSPITGASGNVEFLIHGLRGAPAPSADDFELLVEGRE